MKWCRLAAMESYGDVVGLNLESDLRDPRHASNEEKKSWQKRCVVQSDRGFNIQDKIKDLSRIKLI